MRVSILALFLLTAGFGQLPDGGRRPDPGAGNLPAQRIGPNDLLGISVYDAPEFTRTVRVGAGGEVRLPMLKRRIGAAGKYPAELEQIIAAALEEEEILVRPVVSVTVAEYHSRPVSVSGAVRNPLTFQAAGPVTLLDAITRAGGLAENPGPDILVTRRPEGADEPLTWRIPVKGLLERADPELNLRLEGGDEIRVLELGQVFVVGNVKRPGLFHVNANGRSTVLEVLAMSEGLLPFAGKLAYVYRRGDSASAPGTPIELRKIIRRQAPDVELLPNDILYVPDNRGRRISAAALEKILLFGTTAGATALIYGSR